MTGGTGVMKSTQFRHAEPSPSQIRRIRRIIREELTDLQREAILGVYFQGKSLTRIAKERNVSKSTVCRTLKRAEEKLKRFLQY